MKDWASDFQRGQEALEARRKGWERLERMAEPLFRSFCRCAKRYGLPDNWYVSPYKELAPTTSMRWLTLHSGSSAVAVAPNGRSFVAEGGCALHIVQDVKGEVWAILYPFQTEYCKQREEFLVVHHLAHPAKVTKGWLQRRIRQLRKYARFTSMAKSAKRQDRVSVWWARQRNKRAGRCALVVLLGMLIDVLRAVPILSKFLPRLGRREPELDDSPHDVE